MVLTIQTHLRSTLSLQIRESTITIWFTPRLAPTKRQGSSIPSAKHSYVWCSIKNDIPKHPISNQNHFICLLSRNHNHNLVYKKISSIETTRKHHTINQDLIHSLYPPRTPKFPMTESARRSRPPLPPNNMFHQNNVLYNIFIMYEWKCRSARSLMIEKDLREVAGSQAIGFGGLNTWPLSKIVVMGKCPI